EAQMHRHLVAQASWRDVQRIGHELSPSLFGADAIEVGAREHPLVVEISIARVGSRTLAPLVVVQHPRDETETLSFALGRGGLGENPTIDELEQRVARLERL